MASLIVHGSSSLYRHTTTLSFLFVLPTDSGDDEKETHCLRYFLVFYFDLNALSTNVNIYFHCVSKNLTQTGRPDHVSPFEAFVFSEECAIPDLV